MANLNELGSLIAESVGEYVQNVKEGIDKEVIKTGKEAYRLVREGAPVNHGAYKKAISMKTESQLLGNKKVTIYVKKPHYRLTHLLEDGHALIDGGRSKSFKHWKPAEIKAKDMFTSGVEKVIESGGRNEV